MVIYKGITHICIGVVAYSLLFNGSILRYIFVILGSLFPDIDTPFSYLGRRVFIIPYILKHRGFFHTILGWSLFFTITNILFGKYCIAFGVGYLLHLLADTFTPMGIMWEYPFSKKYYSFSNDKINYRKHEYTIIIVCLMYMIEKWFY